MANGYVILECSECGRTVRQRCDDLALRPFRICPGCGGKIELPTGEDD